MTKIDTSTEAVEALLKDVTPGPWRTGLLDTDGTGLNIPQMPKRKPYFGIHIRSDKKPFSATFLAPHCHADDCCDADFIAASRQLVPALLTERDQLRDELDAAYAIIAAERGEVIKLRAALSKKDQANDH